MLGGTVLSRGRGLRVIQRSKPAGDKAALGRPQRLQNRTGIGQLNESKSTGLPKGMVGGTKGMVGGTRGNVQGVSGYLAAFSTAREVSEREESAGVGYKGAGGGIFVAASSLPRGH